MTIREYIRRRVGLALATAFAPAIAFEIAMLPSVASGNLNPVLAIAAFGLLMIPGALIYLAVRCPKCSKRIAPQIANQIAFPPFLSKMMGEPVQRNCPSSGTNLDEPMPIKLVS